MPPGKANLPALANAGTSRWRRWHHPVYARAGQPRDEWTWRAQEWPSARGWLDQAVQDGTQSFSDAVRAAIGETSRYLEGH